MEGFVGVVNGDVGHGFAGDGLADVVLGEVVGFEALAGNGVVHFGKPAWFVVGFQAALGRGQGVTVEGNGFAAAALCQGFLVFAVGALFDCLHSLVGKPLLFEIEAVVEIIHGFAK